VFGADPSLTSTCCFQHRAASESCLRVHPSNTQRISNGACSRRSCSPCLQRTEALFPAPLAAYAHALISRSKASLRARADSLSKRPASFDVKLIVLRQPSYNQIKITANPARSAPRFHSLRTCSLRNEKWPSEKDLAFPIPSDSWKLELSQAIFDLCQTSDSGKPLLPQNTCLACVVILT